MTTITTEDLIRILDEKLEEKFEQNFSPLNSTILELKAKVEDGMEHVIFVNAKYDELLERVDKMEKEKELIEDENKVLKNCIQQLDQSMTQLGQTYNDLEQYSRRECVEISGIPSPVWKEENLNDIATKIGELTGVKIREDDISVCHRLPQRRRQNDRNKQQRIIVKFVRRDMKDKFYKSRGQLREKTTKDLGYESANRIYLAKSLTEQNKDLFRCCLKFKKDNQYKFIWTSNGKIFLRKDNESGAIHIKSKQDLE
jgi:hypothetical protein